MNQALALAAIGIGGAFGSILRFLVGNWFVQRFGPGFPWGTFVINVSGAFIIGIVLQTAQSKIGLNPYLRLFIATGILGGYTTFSTFAYETYLLSREALRVESFIYAIGSVIAGVAAAYLGVIIVRMWR